MNHKISFDLPVVQPSSPVQIVPRKESKRMRRYLLNRKYRSLIVLRQTGIRKVPSLLNGCYLAAPLKKREENHIKNSNQFPSEFSSVQQCFAQSTGQILILVIMVVIATCQHGLSLVVASIILLLVITVHSQDNNQVIPFNKNLRTALQCGCRLPQPRLVHLGIKIDVQI